jgi:hypothetical protein
MVPRCLLPLSVTEYDRAATLDRAKAAPSTPVSHLRHLHVSCHRPLCPQWTIVLTAPRAQRCKAKATLMSHRWDASGVSSAAPPSGRLIHRRARVSARASTGHGLPCPLGWHGHGLPTLHCASVLRSCVQLGYRESAQLPFLFFRFSTLDSNMLQISRICRDLNSRQKKFEINFIV